MAKDKISPSIDPAAICVLEYAQVMGIPTSFSRAADFKPCTIGNGQSGVCCKNCYMGPCRVTKDGQVGICGATVETIAARNLARAIAAGAAAHSDHGRDLAFTLLGVAMDETQGYEVRDEAKLWSVAAKHGISTKGRSVKEVALDVANKAVSEFGQQRGELSYLSTAPAKRQKIWRDNKVAPRGIDREVVEILHRTHMGDDQDASHILSAAVRTALSDGWGGSMWATDISDILFGTPSPKVGEVNLGCLEEKQVNIIVHGHEPTLSEMIVTAVQDPELIEYAKTKGADGINLAGICCTSNEVMMRQGIPSAGNFLNQELAILTGAVEAMVVDVQCIMQSLVGVADHFHTEIITTSPKVKMTGATHIEFDEHHALDIAKQIVRRACDKYEQRGETRIPANASEQVVPGFSHEYLNYMLGGSYRASFRPLNDAIVSGRIRGVAADVGCNNPGLTQDKVHMDVIRELLKNDVLVVATGCGAIAAGKYGFLRGEAGVDLEKVGPGLREICETIGIPPVLHLGSCVDNSRILTVLSQMATEGGLGDDISDIPAVGLAPEWMSEKALAIATYAAASGAYVIMGVRNPVEFADAVSDILTDEWEQRFGGKIEFIVEAGDIVKATLEHIDKKRAALKLPVYDATRHGASGDQQMEAFLEKPVAEQMAELYG
jgi:anaerobic carbon-monoxide dehydrogenase catalytic subunit